MAVAVPTWVARAEGPEGDFLRGAKIHEHWITSSGYMSCLSASGTYLGKRPTPDVLAAFRNLPEAERTPGGVQVPDLPPRKGLTPSPPEGGLVLRVHARFLTAEDGRLRPAVTTDFPLMREKPRVLESWKLFLEPNTEYMWLTREEKEALVPAQPAKGMRIPVAPEISERMARFHLTPQRATTSEGGIKSKRLIQSAWLYLVVEEVAPDRLHMSLKGAVRWGSTYDAAKALTPNGPLKQGFETQLEGRVVYDRKAETFTRFDLVAPGEVWGRWGDANGKSMYVERPGRQPFGFAFELADGRSPTDRIPPGGNGRYVEKHGYFSSSLRKP